jgi:CHAT domain/SIR2-like domain
MSTFPELEIGLHRWDADNWTVDLRFTPLGNDSENRFASNLSALVDFEGLRKLSTDDVEYGRLLGKGLLGPPDIHEVFNHARVAAQTLGLPLRVRLFIGPSAPELHQLRWETLRDPEHGESLLTDEQFLFSRYLSSIDWGSVSFGPRTELHALIAVANPLDLAKYKWQDRPLPAVDVGAELDRARIGLGDIPRTELPPSGRVTLNNIIDHLRRGHDILYLVCHGTFGKGQSQLWLENDDGTTAHVSGTDMVDRLRDLARRPRLVVLVSCQSAGAGDEAHTTDDGILAALGPRLAAAGIPAVLAIQGNITMATVGEFMPIFFRELQLDGQIDRAMAVARGAVRNRPDWWMPALFMRLKSGRIWYSSGFTEDREGLEKWPALLSSIEQNRCTPILGPGLTESLVGTRQDIARRWAATYQYPMAAYDRENLPQVAQYLAVRQDYQFPRDELTEHLRREMLRRYGQDLPEELRNASVDELIRAEGQQRRIQDALEPHRVLAQLPFKIYITAGLTDLLSDALREVDRDPQVELCRWNDYLESRHSIFDKEPNWRPTVERPLVYHIFGRIPEPESVVLTEDDYFDFLIGKTQHNDMIPEVVRSALNNTALLFLGFHLDEWDFRVLFRSLMSQEGRYLQTRFAHVAVQIDPEEGQIVEPEGARRYLSSYFQNASINIYWGSVESFVEELQNRRERRQGVLR